MGLKFWGMTFLMGVSKNKFAPSPCLFPPTPHLLAILHQIMIVIFNYTKKIYHIHPNL